MVDDFCIDPMHLVYLGVMRKLLYIWVHGRKSMKIRLSWQQMNEISKILFRIQSLISVEFSRKTRTLNELSRFKATEFRLLLLYILPIVLKNRLPDEVYQHFILLHVAIRILSCKRSVEEEANIDYAHSLLTLFIQKSVSIYGDQFLSYKYVHNLIHLGNECKRLGALEMFSCFSFENHIGKLKNLVRKSAKPLQQIVNRVMELRSNLPVQKKSTNPNLIKVIYEHNNGPMIHGLRGQQFERVIFQKLRCGCKSPDNCVVTDDDSVILIENFVEKREGEVYFIGRKLMNSENLYNLNGLDSKTIGTQIVNTLSNNLEFWQLNSISFKAMKIPVIHDIPHSPESFGIVSIMNFDAEN
ncbi:hypothetical protein GHT06_013452 [Daphnia sinensis]|uniref:Uncharacterized protein n=1 Tax=Daphnia sinensis TaxID=1820382 RepID=A0AAD5KUR1_9CRUS|nr:hypothetical protein GHT06_013452 [Daphnia sinensis]